MISEKETGKDLTYEQDLYFCFYDEKLKIQFCSTKDEKLKAGLFAASKYAGFSSTTWTEFQDEIKKRKLISK